MPGMRETEFAEETRNQIHANNLTSKPGSRVFSNLPLQLNEACFNKFLVSDSGKIDYVFPRSKSFHLSSCG